MKLERIAAPYWRVAETVSLPLLSLLCGVVALAEFALGGRTGPALAALSASAFWGGVAVLARRRRSRA